MGGWFDMRMKSEAAFFHPNSLLMCKRVPLKLDATERGAVRSSGKGTVKLA